MILKLCYDELRELWDESSSGTTDLYNTLSPPLCEFLLSYHAKKGLSALRPLISFRQGR